MKKMRSKAGNATWAVKLGLLYKFCEGCNRCCEVQPKLVQAVAVPLQSKCPARHYYQSKAPFFAVTLPPFFLVAVPLEEIKGDSHTSSRIAVSDSMLKPSA